MLNKLLSFIQEQKMLSPGDRVICAVSGGADSMALLWGLYLLRERLQITLEAAHFDHGLRGEESRRDAGFVERFCASFEIPFHLGKGEVLPGEKGLEAAARDARYAFLESLPGKIATAHTADDNGETVLMHLIRGTGLKGLGGIHPIRGRIIRPMLTVDRQTVEAFLKEYSISYIQDSTNREDLFFRNRLRHHIMPLLKEENPKIAGALSRTALLLRQDEAALMAASPETNRVSTLRSLSPALRNRSLCRLLEQWGLRDVRQEYIALMEQLVCSENPSARICLPGGLTVGREYDVLKPVRPVCGQVPRVLEVPGRLDFPEIGLAVTAEPVEEPVLTTDCYTVYPQGEILARSRQPGDRLRLKGGTASLKECFINRKIPAADRMKYPVLADSIGVLGVYSIGANLSRTQGSGQLVRIQFIKTEKETVL